MDPARAGPGQQGDRTGAAASSLTYSTNWNQSLSMASDDTGEIVVARVLYVYDSSHTTLRLRFAAWRTGDTTKTTYQVRLKVDGTQKEYESVTVTTETNDYLDWTISGLTEGNAYELQMTIQGTTDGAWPGSSVYFRHNPKKTMFYANAA